MRHRGARFHNDSSQRRDRDCKGIPNFRQPKTNASRYMYGDTVR